MTNRRITIFKLGVLMNLIMDKCMKVVETFEVQFQGTKPCFSVVYE